MTRRVALLALLCAALLASPALRAGCVNPPGVNGETIYNADHGVMQFCDGASWISMAASGSATEVDPKVGTLESGKWCSSNGTIIACTEDAPVTTPGGSSGQVQYNDGIGLAGAAAVTYATSGDLLMLTSQAATDTPLVVRGAASQTGNLQEWRNGSNDPLMVVTSSGTVGIGTDTPATMLDVTGIIYAQGAGNYVRSQNTAIGQGGYSLNDFSGITSLGGYRTTVNGSLWVYMAGGETTSSIVGGNVGIGTASPSSALEVAGTVTATAFNGSGASLTSQAATDTPLVVKGAAGQSGNLLEFRDSADTLLGHVTPEGGLSLAGALGVTGATVLSGTLGVSGAVTMNSTLGVTGGIDVGAQGFSINGDSHFMRFHANSGSGYESQYVFYNSENNAILHINKVNGIEVLRNGTSVAEIGNGAGNTIIKSGNVGIGTASPSAKLEINGFSNATLKVVDGNQAAGKVLASDADGQASWQYVSGLGAVTGSTGGGSTSPATADGNYHDFPGAGSLNLPSAGTYFISMQVYFVWSSGCVDVFARPEGSHIMYVSMYAKWQACGASGTTNWSTYNFVVVVSAATTITPQYAWGYTGVGSVRLAGANFVKIGN